MLPFQRIVCATDFSEPSLLALRSAARWTKALGVPLVVVHVFDPAPIGPSPAMPMPAWPTATAARAIEKIERKRLAELETTELGGVAHTTEMLSHPSASMGLCDFVNRDDLVIMGTHGRTGIKRMVIGSVAEQVIRHAPCAVVAVRGDIDPGAFPKKMLVCTDFSDAAMPALAYGGRIAKALSVPATLLHTRSEKSWWKDYELSDEERDRHLDDTIRTVLDKLHSEHLPPPVATAFVVAASVPDAIVQHASRDGFDLIVLATHGRTGLSRLVIGSVAERVTRHAACPVLVVRTDPDAVD